MRYFWTACIVCALILGFILCMESLIGCNETRSVTVTISGINHGLPDEVVSSGILKDVTYSPVVMGSSRVDDVRKFPTIRIEWEDGISIRKGSLYDGNFKKGKKYKLIRTDNPERNYYAYILRQTEE